MPAHYALSEALITLAALWCAWKLWPSGYKFAAIGTLMFGAAAAIGIYRFSSGHVEALAHIHQIAGLLGGMFGMALIATELLRLFVPDEKRKSIVLACLLAIGLCLVATSLKPTLAVPFFIHWSLIAIAAAYFVHADTTLNRGLAAAIISVMVFNVTLVRQSTILDPSISWHLFHIIVAFWLVGVCFVLQQSADTHTSAKALST